jgi:hypothetical protein
MKTTMDDLRKAILDVLNGCYKITDPYYGEYAVPKKRLEVLQAEYNIYFVEPNEEQIECI